MQSLLTCNALSLVYFHLVFDNASSLAQTAAVVLVATLDHLARDEIEIISHAFHPEKKYTRGHITAACVRKGHNLPVCKIQISKC